jgi:FkbM family methyltransferase
MVVDKLLTPFLRLPHFKGKTRIEELLRRMLWIPNQTVVFGGARMELDPAEWMQMQLLKGNWLEPRTLELYAKLLQPGDVFVDVGAHVGFHSLVARQLVGSEGLVVAVEPQPYNAEKILANWRANNFTNLKLIVAAASNRDGWVELHDQAIIDRSVLTLRDDGGKNEAQRFEVPSLRLDSIFQRHHIAHAKLLKIDVEGYESEVISGLGDRLRDVQNIVFEILPSAARESTGLTVTQFLRDHGFELRTVEDRQWQPGVPIPENNLWAARRQPTSPMIGAD